MGGYFRWLAVTFVIGIVTATLINVAVDPFGLVGTPVIPGWTTPKNEIIHQARLVRAYEICFFSPAAIALGLSDTGLAIDPSHPGWAARPVRNVSVVGGNIHELRRYFEHAEARRTLKQVLLELDFSAFDDTLQNRPGFKESRLAVPGSDYDPCVRDPERWSMLPSLDVLFESGATVLKNVTGRAAWISTPGGQWIPRDRAKVVKDLGGSAAIFDDQVRWVFSRDLLDPKFRYGDCGRFRSSFDELRNLVATAVRDGIDLRIFISPMHAYLVEARRALGLNAEYASWLRSVVDIVERESSRHPERTPVALWDFGGYNGITTEAVPHAGAGGAAMQWYQDPAHYYPEVGDLLLDRVFGTSGVTRSAPADFGVRLTSANVDRELAEWNQRGVHYRESHPRDVAEIEAMIRDTLRLRKLRGLAEPPVAACASAGFEPPVRGDGV